MRSHTPSTTGAARPTGTTSAALCGVDAFGVLDSIGVAIIVADGRGAIQYRNAAAASMLPAGDTLDAVFASVRFHDSFTNWPARLRGADGSGPTGGVRATLAATSVGAPRLLRIRMAPMAVGRNQVPQATVLLIEGDAPVQVDDESYEVSRRLTSLGKLAARVAHELNNPLDGILRYINLALRIAAEAPEPRLQSYLSESRTGLMRMVQIIGDLLEFTRCTDAGFEDRGVNEVVDEAIRACAAAADANGVVVTADFQSREMPRVRGSRLYQVCCNLIRNAVDAMPDGGRLTITSGLVAGDVVIRVADTGVGLPEPVERVFEPFFTTKQPGKGTGLGLAISRDFIHDMGGTIVAAQSEERGAVVTVRVPVAGLAGPKQGAPREK